MAELSPTAQAVLDAANVAFDSAGTTGQGIAAAICAAADQVVPEACASLAEEIISGPIRKAIRHQLLAIAAELEGGPETTIGGRG